MYLLRQMNEHKLENFSIYITSKGVFVLTNSILCKNRNLFSDFFEKYNLTMYLML
ncbi:MAG: hypothetical protein E7623_03265 [Ruminococcaceae bacterium]|nr:hypothetical protein [Oscillospiraceae bacterium]